MIQLSAIETLSCVDNTKFINSRCNDEFKWILIDILVIKWLKKKRKNVIVRIIYIYDFKDYKILAKKRSSYFSKVESSTKKRKNK